MCHDVCHFRLPSAPTKVRGVSSWIIMESFVASDLMSVALFVIRSGKEYLK